MSSLQPKDGSFDPLQEELESMFKDAIAAAAALAHEKTTSIFTTASSASSAFTLSKTTPPSMHQEYLRSYQASTTHSGPPRQDQDIFMNTVQNNKDDDWSHIITDGNGNDSTPKGNPQGQAYQLQQWAYENRQQELTVTEKLEMSKWEHAACRDDDWPNTMTDGRDAAVFKKTAQGLPYQLQQWTCETRQQELTVAEILEKRKLEHGTCEENGLSHMPTYGSDEASNLN